MIPWLPPPFQKKEEATIWPPTLETILQRYGIWQVTATLPFFIPFQLCIFISYYIIFLRVNIQIYNVCNYEYHTYKCLGNFKIRGKKKQDLHEPKSRELRPLFLDISGNSDSPTVLINEKLLLTLRHTCGILKSVFTTNTYLSKSL